MVYTVTDSMATKAKYKPFHNYQNNGQKHRVRTSVEKSFTLNRKVIFNISLKLCKCHKLEYKDTQSEYWLNVGMLVLICMMSVTKTTSSKWISFIFSIPFIEYMNSYNYSENRILYLVLPPLPSSKPQKLFMLPWHKVHCCVFKQCSEHKEKTYSHPDVNSFYIRDLQDKEARNKIMESCRCGGNDRCA